MKINKSQWIVCISMVNSYGLAMRDESVAFKKPYIPSLVSLCIKVINEVPLCAFRVDQVLQWSPNACFLLLFRKDSKEAVVFDALSLEKIKAFDIPRLFFLFLRNYYLEGIGSTRRVIGLPGM